MKFLLIYLLFMLCAFVTLGSNDPLFSKKPTVYYLPVVGEINPTMVSYFNECIKEAKSQKVDLIIILMNSYGGYLSSCDDIRKVILRSDIPVWTFVDNKAISAGAMITVSTEKIFMTEDALMGASTVVIDKKPLYDKFQSLARARMRGSAVLNCRDPKIAEDMVGYYDKESKQERVLSLTAQEALEVNYCNGIYNSLIELIDSELPGSNVICPSDDLIDLVMSNQASVSESSSDNWFQIIFKRILNNLWIVFVIFLYGNYCKVTSENKTLKTYLREMVRGFDKK